MPLRRRACCRPPAVLSRPPGDSREQQGAPGLDATTRSRRLGQPPATPLRARAGRYSGAGTASTARPRTYSGGHCRNPPDSLERRPGSSDFHGTNVSGERQRPGAIVPWSTSGAGPQAKPKAPAVGHFHGTIVAGSVSDRRAFVPWSTSGAGPQAEPKAPAVGHFHGTIVAGSVSDRRAFVPWSTSGAGPQAEPKAPAVGHVLDQMDRRFRFQHYVSFPARELGYVITFRSGHRNRASVVREGMPS